MTHASGGQRSAVHPPLQHRRVSEPTLRIIPSGTSEVTQKGLPCSHPASEGHDVLVNVDTNTTVAFGQSAIASTTQGGVPGCEGGNERIGSPLSKKRKLDDISQASGNVVSDTQHGSAEPPPSFADTEDSVETEVDSDGLATVSSCIALLFDDDQQGSMVCKLCRWVHGHLGVPLCLLT